MTFVKMRKGFAGFSGIVFIDDHNDPITTNVEHRELTN